MQEEENARPKELPRLKSKAPPVVIDVSSEPAKEPADLQYKQV
jgi:hypothetical protein